MLKYTLRADGKYCTHINPTNQTEGMKPNKYIHHHGYISDFHRISIGYSNSKRYQFIDTCTTLP